MKSICRKRITEEFRDGDKCILLLKDRGKIFKNDLEEEWYEMAYGKKRNVMKFTVKITIPETVKFQTKHKFYAAVDYQIFPEHEKEFPGFKLPALIELDNDAKYPNDFEKEIEVPFGTISATLKFKEVESDEPHKPPQDVTIASITQAFKTFCEPKPISMAEQAVKDKLEEEENKRKENEARAAQEKLEAEKERLRKEQMQQIKKQEANANKLMVFTKAMTLSFHTVSIPTLATLRAPNFHFCILENRRLQPVDVVLVDLSLGDRTKLHALLEHDPSSFQRTCELANHPPRLLSLLESDAAGLEPRRSHADHADPREY